MNEKSMKALAEVVDILLNSEMPKRVSNVFALMHTLIVDDKLNELEAVLRLHFPEYYTDYKPFEVSQ